jgi:toxin ParE1/3/4
MRGWGCQWIPMSGPNLRLELTHRSRADLRDILTYSISTWGNEIAENYRAKLVKSMGRIAEYPEIGSEHPELGPNIRTYPIGEHVVIYTNRPNSVSVLRVVHIRRNLSREKI